MRSHYASRTRRGTTPLITTLLALLAALALLVAACSSDDGEDGSDDSTGGGGEAAGEEATDFPEVEVDPDVRPIVFVHGSSGSGAQFESQALRFASNGYPIEYLAAVDYNSPEVESAGVPETLDELIAELQETSGQDQVDLMGHSLGTFVSGEYLNSSEERAASVAHYVNIDGRPWPEPPGGVDTLALWGEPGFGPDDEGETGDIEGAENVHFDDQAHVQVATSPESFEEMYEFFNGEPPATTEILPEEEPEISGKAVNFPQNEGVAGATLEVYEVDPDTGYRIDEEPNESFTIEDDGSWGPFVGEHGASYELVILRTDDPEARPHHFYLQPLDRSDHLVRLNTSPPGGGVGALVEQHADSMALVVSRYKEWWGDQDEGSDQLVVDGEDVLNAQTAPRDSNAIGVLMFDAGGDSESELEVPIETIFGIGFLTGIDVAIPASDPPDRTVSVTAVPRGDEDAAVTVNIPNWSGAADAVSIHFRE